MRKRHKQDRDKLGEKIDSEAQRQEQELRKEHETEKERLLREKRNRQAAELAARTDLSDDQLKAVCKLKSRKKKLWRKILAIDRFSFFFF